MDTHLFGNDDLLGTENRKPLRRQKVCWIIQEVANNQSQPVYKALEISQIE